MKKNEMKEALLDLLCFLLMFIFLPLELVLILVYGFLDMIRVICLEIANDMKAMMNCLKEKE